MALTPRVNGPAIVYVGAGYDARSGSGQSPGAMTNLGISSDGVELDWQYFYRPIMADTGGPDVPVTQQQTGMLCRISFDLVLYDEAVLAPIRQRPSAASEGVLESIGRIMAATDFTRLFIDSPTDSLPWNFPTVLLDGDPVKVGTMKNVWRMSFAAFPYIGVALAATGAVLYNRVTTGKP